jgi:hypothetical protein
MIDSVWLPDLRGAGEVMPVKQRKCPQCALAQI